MLPAIPHIKISVEFALTIVITHAPNMLNTEVSSEGLSQCDQKGSLVDAEKLRFDFSWPCALTAAQTAQVEGIVNERIKAALPVHAQVVPLADATKITALRQVFGERYPDPVCDNHFKVIIVCEVVEFLLLLKSVKYFSGRCIYLFLCSIVANVSTALAYMHLSHIHITLIVAA